MTNFTGLAALLATLALWGFGPPPAPAADTAPRLVEFESPLAGPQALQGFLRVPDGPGPWPAVVLMHGCGGGWRSVDERWGKRLAEWGYVALTIDRFGTRGITSACTGGLPPSTLYDAYRALDYLVGQPSVDPSRVAVLGFSQGATLALLAVERGQIEGSSKEKFRAAIGFYPLCGGVKGNMTVPTLILVGELDDWAPANACRNLAEGRDDWGMAREKDTGIPIAITVYPGAHHDFDVPSLRTPQTQLGHHLEFNAAARDQSVDALRNFLYSTIGGQERPQ
ncbi:dienelactone hydrolase family protein [Bradyrhizobium sp. USDA 3364]